MSGVDDDDDDDHLFPEFIIPLTCLLSAQKETFLFKEKLNVLSVSQLVMVGYRKMHGAHQVL